MAAYAEKPISTSDRFRVLDSHTAIPANTTIAPRETHRTWVGEPGPHRPVRVILRARTVGVRTGDLGVGGPPVVRIAHPLVRARKGSTVASEEIENTCPAGSRSVSPQSVS